MDTESKVLEVVNNGNLSVEKILAMKDIGVDPSSLTNPNHLYENPEYLKMMLSKHANIKSEKGPIYTQKSLEKRTAERRIKNKRAAKARRK